MIEPETIAELVREKIRGTGIFLVGVDVRSGNNIRVLVDRHEGISIDECVEISRFLNERLDRDREDYSLEVSSPGLGSPFRVREQYEKNLGRAVEVILTQGGSLRGELEGVSQEGITINTRGTLQEIGFSEIKKAKSIVTFN